MSQYLITDDKGNRLSVHKSAVMAALALLIGSGIAHAQACPSGASCSGGSGLSTIGCSGFVPIPCARKDLAATLDINGNATTGAYTLGTMTLLTPVVDDFFGERMVKVTDATSNSGAQYGIPTAGWRQLFSCAGALGCNATSPEMFVIEKSGGNGRVYQLPSSMVPTRQDATTLNGSDTTFNALENFSSVDNNRMFAAPFSNETTGHAMYYGYYEWNPASPGPQSPVKTLVFNAGPHGNSNDTGMPGSASMLDGALTLVSFAAVVAPTVSTSSCGATANCIQVSTTGGSCSGTVAFSFTEDAADAATLLHEQNLAGCNGCFTSFTFTAGTGSVVAFNAPTATVSPVGVNWHLYAENIANVNLAIQQFQVAYSGATTCSGSGGGACPALPLTSLITGPITATNHLNASCEQTQTRAADCYLAQVTLSKTDGQFTYATCGVGQDLDQCGCQWDTVKGNRCLHLDTATITNGSTDAAGVSCGTATDCWTAPTGAITRVTDPNDATLVNSYGGGLHESWSSLDGAFVFLQPNQVAAANESTWIWPINGTTVYVGSSAAAASSVGAHQAEGYTHWMGFTAGNPALDGEWDTRTRILNTGTAPGSCANQVFSGISCLFNYANYSNMGPCSFGGNCTFPTPNFGATNYANIGITRRNGHCSMVHEIPGDPYPFLCVSYTQSNSYTIAANGCTRSSGVATIALTTPIAFMPLDSVTVTGCTGDANFAGTYSNLTLSWSSTGTSSFSYTNAGSNVSTGIGGGTVVKADPRPSRALEDEIYMQSMDGLGTTWRFGHEHYAALGSVTITGPSGVVSQNGHYAMTSGYDGTRTDPIITELK